MELQNKNFISEVESCEISKCVSMKILQINTKQGARKLEQLFLGEITSPCITRN